MADERLSVDEHSDRMHSRPVPHTFDEMLFATLCEQILEALDLGNLLVGDGDHRIAMLKDRPAPIGQAVDLPRQVGAEILHEIGDLLGVIGNQQEMDMI